MAGGVEAGDAVDNGGEGGPLVLLDEPPVADVLEPPVGDVGRDPLHGVEAEVAAVGEDRGEQRAHFPGVDPLLAGLLEVDAEPEVVLDLDEEVGEPDRAAAGVQPAVEFGEAVGLRRVGLLGRVRLQPPPVVVERDLAVVSDALQEPVERIRQTRLQLLDRRVGVDGEPGSRPERFALVVSSPGYAARLVSSSSTAAWRGEGLLGRSGRVTVRRDPHDGGHRPSGGRMAMAAPPTAAAAPAPRPRLGDKPAGGRIPGRHRARSTQAQKAGYHPGWRDFR